MPLLPFPGGGTASLSRTFVAYLRVRFPLATVMPTPPYENFCLPPPGRDRPVSQTSRLPILPSFAPSAGEAHTFTHFAIPSPQVPPPPSSFRRFLLFLPEALLFFLRPFLIDTLELISLTSFLLLISRYRRGLSPSRGVKHPTLL